METVSRSQQRKGGMQSVTASAQCTFSLQTLLRAAQHLQHERAFEHINIFNADYDAKRHERNLNWRADSLTSEDLDCEDLTPADQGDVLSLTSDDALTLEVLWSCLGRFTYLSGQYCQELSTLTCA